MAANKGNNVKDRARINRQVRQDELRAKFQGVQYIKHLDELAKEYTKVRKELDKATAIKQRLTAKDREQKRDINETLNVIRLKLDVIKQQVDLEIRRLKFVVPELRAVELTDSEGDNPLNPLVRVLQQALAEGK